MKGGGRSASVIPCGETMASSHRTDDLRSGSSAGSEIRFRFDPIEHKYVELETGFVFPSITQMLSKGGWIDDTWYTEESAERGRAVHKLTADYDLGALDLASCVSRYRGYLLSHVQAVRTIQPEFVAIEEARVHPVYRFAGTTDRAGLIYRLAGVMEGKSGEPHKAHAIQTALQAILEADRFNLKPEQLARYVLYWRANGRFMLEEFTRRRDFDEAWRLLDRFACR